MDAIQLWVPIHAQVKSHDASYTGQDVNETLCQYRLVWNISSHMHSWKSEANEKTNSQGQSHEDVASTIPKWNHRKTCWSRFRNSLLVFQAISMNIHLQTQVATPSEGSKIAQENTIPLQSHRICRSIWNSANTIENYPQHLLGILFFPLQKQPSKWQVAARHTTITNRPHR